MNWRNILRGAKTDSPEQNPQNSQKTTGTAISANSANIAGPDPDGIRNQLLDAIEPACRGRELTAEEVVNKLSSDDISDWRNGRINNQTLTTFVRSLIELRAMESGQRPDHYIAVGYCEQCGPIWSWHGGRVIACPWCRNRLEGRPIPRPYQDATGGISSS